MNGFKALTTALAALAALALPGTALAKPGDRDGDKLPDRFEKAHRLSVTKKDAKGDPDRDGLTNLGELRSKTDPRDADSDNDRVGDADEDADRDKVDHGNEADQGTHPRDADSDGDGRKDGAEDRDRDRLTNAAEDATGNDPTDPDTDGDGRKDGAEHAGTVQRLVGDVLTIKLATGSVLSGKVTPDTEVSCETEDEHEAGDEADDEAEDEAEDDADDEAGLEAEAGGVALQRRDRESSGSGSSPRDSEDVDEGTDEEDEGDQADDIDWEEQGDDDDVCGPSELVAGVAVHEAEIEDGVFEEVEILR